MSRRQPVDDAQRPAVDRSPRQVAVVSAGLGLSYLIMWLPALTPAVRVDLPGTGPSTALWLNWLAVGLLLGYVLAVERLPLSSLLLRRPRWSDLEWTLIFFGLVMAWSWIVGLLRPQPPNPGTSMITATPVVAVAALVLTVGVTEEILLKAYPIERLTSLTGRRWVGVTVSVVIFVLPHLAFFDPDWLLYQGPGTVAAYGLYLWRRNLPACMLLHVLSNAPILIPTVLG